LGVGDYHSGDDNGDDEPVIVSTNNNSGVIKKKSKKRRHSYSVKEKKRILEIFKQQVIEHDRQEALMNVSQAEGVPYHTLEKWTRPKGEQKIVQMMKVTKFDKSTKRVIDKCVGYYPSLEADAIKQVRAKFKTGIAVCAKDLLELATSLNNNFYHHEKAQFTRRWATAVLERNDLALRAPQNTKRDSVEVAIPKVLEYHRSLRQLIRTKMYNLVSYHLLYILFFLNFIRFGEGLSLLIVLT
jgi:hypothetical protein